MLMTAENEDVDLEIKNLKVRRAEIDLEEVKIDLAAATALRDRLLSAGVGVSTREMEEVAFAVKRLGLEVEKYSLRLELARLGEYE